MKLPEYDNRPGPGAPLYSTDDDGWHDLIFPALGIGLPILILLCFGFTIQGLFELLRWLIH